MEFGAGPRPVRRPIAFPSPKVYLCPADPSGITRAGFNPNFGNYAVSNYAFNWQVWQTGMLPKIPATFQDGAAGTGLMYEKFGYCKGLEAANNASSVWSATDTDRVSRASVPTNVPGLTGYRAHAWNWPSILIY